MSNQNTNNQNSISFQSEQVLSSEILLGAILRITGLTIVDVQNIVRGWINPTKSSTDIKNFILENAEHYTSLSEKILSYDLNINIICDCLNINSSYTKEILQENIYNPNFILNSLTFLPKHMKEKREKLILLLSDPKKCGKKLSTKDIAFLLNITPNLVYQAKRRYSQKHKKER